MRNKAYQVQVKHEGNTEWTVMAEFEWRTDAQAHAFKLLSETHAYTFLIRIYNADTYGEWRIR